MEVRYVYYKPKATTKITIQKVIDNKPTKVYWKYNSINPEDRKRGTRETNMEKDKNNKLQDARLKLNHIDNHNKCKWSKCSIKRQRLSNAIIYCLQERHFK